MRIFDTCIFYNEIDMLDLRLHILEPVVDYFVVCEAKKTHSGKPKPLYFAELLNRLPAELRRKIVYVTLDLPDDVHSWDRERMHRRTILSGLATVAEVGDLVVVGDCDEIANPDVIATIPSQGARLELDFFYYNLNTRVREGWSIGCLPYAPGLDPNDIRTLTGYDVPTINHGGWHFSYFLSPEGVMDKLDAFMHHDDVARDIPRDPAWIAQKIAAGQDLFGRTTVLEHVEIEDTLPRYLLENLEKYPQWVGVKA